MKKSMGHLQQLVNDILDMSKIESGKMVIENQSFNLKELLTGVVEEFGYTAREWGIGLSQAGNIRRCQVLSDPLRLREMLGNLLSNALKFTPAAGFVALIVEEELTSGRSSFTFRVKDSGCGISEENQKIIFEVFEQGDGYKSYGHAGSGLGLSICKNLVSLLGRELQVSSRLGEGAEFYFTLTLNVAECLPEQVPLPQAKDQYHFHGCRVLLAEDNELNAEIASTLLCAHGFTVENAVNGQEALDRFLKMPESYYDLVLMDIQMPVMNGFAAARAIRSSGKGYAPSVPILAMSANTLTEDVDNSLKAGMNGHIAKPVDIQSLLETLSSFISRNTASVPD